jgi:hypothetical protein
LCANLFSFENTKKQQQDIQNSQTW